MTASDPTRARDGSPGDTVRSGQHPNEGMVTGDERVRLAENFGARLATERRRVGLTQDALAARAGYSSAHVARLERGERRPTDSTTWRLAKAITETWRGNMAAMVNWDVRLMVAAGESLRMLYTNPTPTALAAAGPAGTGTGACPPERPRGARRAHRRGASRSDGHRTVRRRAACASVSVLGSAAGGT